MPVNNYNGHEVEDVGAFLGGGDDNRGNDTQADNVTASEDVDILSLTTRKQRVMAMGQMLASTSESGPPSLSLIRRKEKGRCVEWKPSR